jgi:hypothetical protein
MGRVDLLVRIELQEHGAIERLEQLPWRSATARDIDGPVDLAADDRVRLPGLDRKSVV